MDSNLDLGANHEAALDELVASGHFDSRVEVLREGVRLVREREARLAEFDAAIEQGLASADAGDVYDLEEVAARLDAKYAALDRRVDEA